MEDSTSFDLNETSSDQIKDAYGVENAGQLLGAEYAVAADAHRQSSCR